MTHRSLAEVRARLEETVSTLPVQATSPAELYCLYEDIAIAVLDSEFSNYLPGELEAYLKALLYLKQLELGLVAFPNE